MKAILRALDYDKPIRKRRARSTFDALEIFGRPVRWTAAERKERELDLCAEILRQLKRELRNGN
jgi:hypothetical protein